MSEHFVGAISTQNFIQNHNPTSITNDMDIQGNWSLQLVPEIMNHDIIFKNCVVTSTICQVVVYPRLCFFHNVNMLGNKLDMHCHQLRIETGSICPIQTAPIFLNRKYYVAIMRYWFFRYLCLLIDSWPHYSQYSVVPFHFRSHSCLANLCSQIHVCNNVLCKWFNSVRLGLTALVTFD